MADLWAVHIDEQKKVVFVPNKPFLMLHHRAWANKMGQLTSSVFARAERLSATSQHVSGTFLQPACMYLGPFRLKAFLKAWTNLVNSKYVCYP